MFTVYYTNILVSMIREVVICILLAAFVCSCISQLTRSAFSSKVSAPESSSTVTDQPERSQTPLQSIFASEEEKPAYIDGFHSLILLEGAGIDASLILEESDTIKNGVKISGYGMIGPLGYTQFFNVDIERPEGNVFTCYDSQHSSTLTVTFYPDDHILNVVQETTDPDVPEIYTGTYVDNETWDGLLEERRAATQNGQLFWEEYFAQNDPTYPSTDNTDQFVQTSPSNGDGYSDYNLYFYEGYYTETSESVEVTLSVVPNGSSFACELFWNYGQLLELGTVRPGVPTLLSEGTTITIDLEPSGNIHVLLEGEGLLEDSYSFYMMRS